MTFLFALNGQGLLFSNNPFQSYHVFQNDFHMKMNLIFMKMNLWVGHIFIWMVSLTDSFWHRGKKQLGNGIFNWRKLSILTTGWWYWDPPRCLMGLCDVRHRNWPLLPKNRFQQTIWGSYIPQRSPPLYACTPLTIAISKRYLNWFLTAFVVFEFNF